MLVLRAWVFQVYHQKGGGVCNEVNIVSAWWHYVEVNQYVPDAMNMFSACLHYGEWFCDDCCIHALVHVLTLPLFS